MVLTPKATLGAHEVARGLRWLIWDGVASQIMACLTSGAVLTSFALLAGASNVSIGLIAAIAPLSQVMQVPAVALVERFRHRKVLVLACSGIARPVWLLVAALPWLVADDDARVFALIACLVCFNALSTISSCAFNSWKRDIVPEHKMGSYFAQRLMLATLVGAVFTFLGGVVLDLGETWMSDQLKLFAVLFVGGAMAGLSGVFFLSHIPEPMMLAREEGNLWRILIEPLRDVNYRALVRFLAQWNLAANFAAPFMTVYMIRRLELSMGWVLGLTAISQVVNMLFLGVWGRFADRFSNKSALSVAGSLFVFSLLLWPFTTIPEPHALTLPLLIFIHLLAGLALGGVNLCTGGIALKLAPRGKAAAFLAVNAIVSGAASTLAPAIGGVVAGALDGHAITVAVQWTSSVGGVAILTPIDIRGLDFLFAIAFVLGLYALHRLLAVREQGSIAEKNVAQAFYTELRKLVRPGALGGLRQLTQFPFAAMQISRYAETSDQVQKQRSGDDKDEAR